MNIKYYISPLEQWIEDLYKKNHITQTKHLSIEVLAKKFNIWIHYMNKRSKGIEASEGVYTMVIDSQQSVEVQWLEFLHELCHLLRHAGNQTLMPEQFTMAQENEADRFIFYAAIPFFLVQRMTLPVNRGEAIGYIARKFKVPVHFAEERFEQIEDRVKQGELLAAIETAVTMETKVSGTTDNVEFENDHSTVRIKAFYDYDDFSRPHTLVIEQREGFNWEEPLYIEVDGDYRSCDLPSHGYREGAVVQSGDLSISPNHKGYVIINLSRVAWRHGTSASRLYLPMEAIDDTLNF